VTVIKLTATRENVLREVDRGRVFHDNLSLTHISWVDSGVRSQWKTCTAQVDWLVRVGLVSYDTSEPAYRVPVTLTPAGRDWLDANPKES